MDAGASPLLVTNVTSNGYAMAADTAAYVANRINGKGNVVMFVLTRFRRSRRATSSPTRSSRTIPTSRSLDRVTPDVKDGGIADSRAKMEAILAANPGQGQHRRGLGGLGSAGARARCRRSRRPAAATRASSSPASTPIRRRARRSPRAAISRLRWRRISRASADTTADAVKRYARRREDQAERDLRADQD